MKCKKTFTMAVICILAIFIMTLPVFASMNTFYWNNVWSGQFGTNSITSYNTRETILIQRAVNSMLGSSGGLTADGVFGNQTKNKVITVQTNTGLTSDGIVGANTWWQLQEYPAWIYSGPTYSANRNCYYYEYRTVHDGNHYYIRHYSDGYWYVKHNNGNWYKVN